MSAFSFRGVECFNIFGVVGFIANARTQKHSEAYRTPNAVLQLTDNGEIIAEYPSIGIASKAVGISECCIRAVLKGVNKHAGGYKWKRKI